MKTFRISLRNDKDYYTTYYCGGYPSEASLKSYLLSSAKTNSSKLGFNLTSLNFSKDACGDSILECYYLYYGKITFMIHKISEVILDSGRLEKYLTDQNPAIRELVKKEIRDV